MNPASSYPIGLFDSGIGGLTVFRELSRLLPKEDLIYFGDTARLPYGNKSAEAVIRFTLESARFLLKQKIKLLIVACHTASAHALDHLQRQLPIPVIGVIQPGLEMLYETSRSKRAALLATTGTIASGAYQEQLQRLAPSFTIYPVACPLFVPLAEEDMKGHPATALIAEHYLSFLQHKQIDAALLACTHFPLLKDAIEKALGSHVAVIESAPRCAQHALAQLFSSRLLNQQWEQPVYRFFATDNPPRFAALAKLFLGYPLKNVQEPQLTEESVFRLK